jgi:hypothetical protein
MHSLHPLQHPYHHDNSRVLLLRTLSLIKEQVSTSKHVSAGMSFLQRVPARALLCKFPGPLRAQLYFDALRMTGCATLTLLASLAFECNQRRDTCYAAAFIEFADAAR